MSKSLQEQYIVYYVVLGELPFDAPDADSDAMYSVHKQAYKLVDAEHRSLPTFHNRILSGDEVIDLTAFEMCQDDSETKNCDGKMGWPICVFAHGMIPGQPLIEMRELVISAYTRAAAAVKPGVSVRFAMADRQQVFRVTETVPVDFSTLANEEVA